MNFFFPPSLICSAREEMTIGIIGPTSQKLASCCLVLSPKPYSSFGKDHSSPFLGFFPLGLKGAFDFHDLHEHVDYSDFLET